METNWVRDNNSISYVILMAEGNWVLAPLRRRSYLLKGVKHVFFSLDMFSLLRSSTLIEWKSS
jgi:hypothetical protein